MNRRTALTLTAGSGLALALANSASAGDADQTTQDTLDTVVAFMTAMGSGDMDAMNTLMADDMVWHNEGDSTLPWIGISTGKDAIFAFLGVFSSNLQVTAWDNTDAFASGDTAAVFGQMDAIATRSGAQTGMFSFALRAKVRNGQVTLWHWHEDSFAVSRAYHA